MKKDDNSHSDGRSLQQNLGWLTVATVSNGGCYKKYKQPLGKEERWTDIC
jgi:hypothetical protein